MVEKIIEALRQRPCRSAKCARLQEEALSYLATAETLIGGIQPNPRMDAALQRGHLVAAIRLSESELLSKTKTAVQPDQIMQAVMALHYAGDRVALMS